MLNGNFRLCYSPGGFWSWWRQLHDVSERDLDNTHLMRMAGRFSRRVRGYAKAKGIPIIDCGSDEKKHQIAEEYPLWKRSKANGPFKSWRPATALIQIKVWKEQLIAEAPEIFTRSGIHGNEAVEQEKAELYQQIGKLQVELD